MASKTGSLGLVALFLSLNITTILAVSSESANYRHTMHWGHGTGTTIATKPTATPFTNGTSTTSSPPGGTSGGSGGSTSTTSALNATASDCFLTLPDDALTAAGLSTPFQLMPPCSQTVNGQQSFAEAAVFDPATGDISIYHPLIIDAGKTPQVKPILPTIPAGASVALWFGFNGGTLQLLDTRGENTNTSPTLKAIDCVNGLPGVNGDVFGQVSWCNTIPFFAAANTSIAAGKTIVPPLGTDKNGQDCPSSRSFTLVDACPSDNLPTTYLLLSDNTTVQNTAANLAKFPTATVLDNASDEALLSGFIDPVIGCTPFQVPSLDDPGAMVASLATQELQAASFQKAPVARVALNDPDTLLTASGDVSTSKTNAYRLGVNQDLLGTGPNTDDGALTPYCDGMIEIAPPFFQANQAGFTAATTPDTGVGNNLFTFMCARYLQSLTLLTCPPNATQPIACQFDGTGAATSCTITLAGNSTADSGSGMGNGSGSGSGTGPSTSSSISKGSGAGATSGLRSASASTSAFVPASTSKAVSSATTLASVSTTALKTKDGAGAIPTGIGLAEINSTSPYINGTTSEQNCTMNMTSPAESGNAFGKRSARLRRARVRSDVLW